LGSVAWRGRRGRDRMVVGFTTTLTYPISANALSSNPSSKRHCFISESFINSDNISYMNYIRKANLMKRKFKQ